jgi:hypothetical protein
MGSSAILDAAALKVFLEGSRQSAFSRQAEWARLLSLEMALTFAHKAQAQMGASSRP